jgi:hypothetical protein
VKIGESSEWTEVVNKSEFSINELAKHVKAFYENNSETISYNFLLVL